MRNGLRASCVAILWMAAFGIGCEDSQEASPDGGPSPALDGASPIPACSGRSVPRCDATCPHCFELVPGYEVCARETRTTGTVTECETDAGTDQCCNDSDCSQDRVCTTTVPDAQNNAPSHICARRDACETMADCEEGSVCVPAFYGELSYACEPAECTSAADCEDGFICAPTLLDQPTGNHGETFEIVRCVPDPATCRDSR